jgi:hypothetical protein
MSGQLLIVVFVGALALTACGGDDVKAGAPGSSSTTSTTVAPGGTVSSPPIGRNPIASNGGPQRIVPTKDAAGVRPMTFDVAQVKAVAGGVLVRFWNGIAPCFVIDHYTVDETAQTVTVGLFAGHAKGSDNVACAELALRYELKVPLDAPLGNRKIVDANA